MFVMKQDRSEIINIAVFNSVYINGNSIIAYYIPEGEVVETLGTYHNMKRCEEVLTSMHDAMFSHSNAYVMPR